MKKIIYFLFVASIFIFSCKTKKEVESSNIPATQVEQNKPGKGNNGGARQQQRIEELYSKLDLSDEKMTQFDAINDKYNEELRTVRDSNKGDRMKMRELMQDINQRKNLEVKSILTEEQYKIYSDYLEERMKNRMKRRYNRQ